MSGFRRGVRPGAYLAGAVLSIAVVFMAHYSMSVVHGSFLAIDHMPAGGIFVFFILVLFLNPLLGLAGKSRLNSEELLIIYIMLLVTSSITTMGLGAQLLPIIAAPFYYATPENRWAELVHPHLRNWMHPSGEREIRHFFEGLPAGESIPWGAWVQPVLAWFVLIAALYMVMLFLMVILRKQWVEKEKLSYPLVQLPIEMVRDDGRGGLAKPLFRNKLLWVAFAVPMVISSMNALHSYFHFIPEIPLDHSVAIFQRTARMRFRLSFPIMGFTYLVNQEVALGVWFFNLLYLFAGGVFNITGITSSENIGIYGAVEPIFKNFGSGAFVAFVFAGFWMAREHLGDVFGKAFGRREADDSEEIVSYRTAVFGLIAGLAVMLGWIMLSGMSFHVALLFVVFAFVFFIGLTRIIAEAGIATMISPSISSGQVASALGSASIGNEGMTALGMTYVYAADIRTFPMSAMAQGLKMGDWIKARRKGGILLAVIFAVLIGYFASNWLVLRLAYGYGGMNLRGWFFVRGPQHPFIWATSHMLHPAGPSLSGWAARGAGAFLMGALMFIRYRFLGWPFHPLGFAVGSVTWIDHLWFSIFIVWLVKALLLKYGGVQLFRQGRPFFLGLILGQYSAAVIWFLADLITGHTGNQVFWI